jgi:hypothetical protein
MPNTPRPAPPLPARLPKATLPVGAALLLLLGAIVGGPVGLVLLLALAGALAWLLVTFWALTPPSGRVLRLLVVLAVALLGIMRSH